MVFYFSGTGNSQLAARQIAGITGDKIVSINQLLKEGGQGTFRSEGPLVFVTPTYAWRIPKVVEQWLRKTRFEGNRDAYFVLTCGNDCGNAAAYARKLCAAKELRFRGLAPVVMPENYLALYPTPSRDECQTILKRAEPVLSALAALIQANKPFGETTVSVKGKLKSGPVNSLYYPLLVHDKGFRVSGGCISCGKCVERCPLNNIILACGKPQWQGHCTHCMACIGGCPAEAIEYRETSKGQHRHYIMEDFT